MYKKFVGMLSVLAVVMCWVMACSASVNIPIDLKRDSADAELICVGRVILPDASAASASEPQLVAEVRIDRVIKGTLMLGSSIHVQYLQGQQHFSEYDLVLLKRQGESYEFSRTECSIPVCETAYSTYQQSNDVLANLRWEMLNSLQSPSAWVAESALEQSSLLLPSDIENYVKPRANDSDTRIRACALRACLAAGVDTEVIPSLDTVEQITIDTKESAVPMALLIELRRLQIRPEMVNSVAAKLNSKSMLVRRLVSFILRQSKLDSAVPHLKIALDDSDSEVRYNAVIGMALITNDKSHAPSMDKFAKDEQRYLDYWKNKKLD